METANLIWYCVRTKPKHEHIAAASVSRNLGLEVFHPRLLVERSTRRGVVRVVEPLFPCYVFIRCAIERSFNDIQFTAGINSFVQFGHRISTIPNTVIEELQECFRVEEPLPVEKRVSPGDEVSLADGAFAGMRAHVLRVLPAGRRVQVLLEILGRQTPVEVDLNSVTLDERHVADLVPRLAAAHREPMLV